MTSLRAAKSTALRLLTKPTGLMPNFLVIGAMKSGTSSLYHYLEAHPEISMSVSKETKFFLPGVMEEKGLAWYQSFFRENRKAIGEASPDYTKHPFYPGCAEKIHALLPQAKLIYVVRDPVERIVSHYWHEVDRGREKRPIAEALRNPSDNDLYCIPSQYHRQWMEYLKLFPQSQTLTVSADDLRDNTREVMQWIYAFLEVDAKFTSPVFDEAFHLSNEKPGTGNKLVRAIWRLGKSFHKRLVRPFLLKTSRKTKSEYAEKLPAEIRERLQDFLRPDTEQLRALTGLSLSEWSI